MKEKIGHRGSILLVFLLIVSFLGNHTAVKAATLSEVLNRGNVGRDLEFAAEGFVPVDTGYSVRAYNHGLKDGAATLRTKVKGPGKISFMFVVLPTYESVKDYDGGIGGANCAFYVDGISLFYENWELDKFGTVLNEKEVEIPAGEHELMWEYTYSGEDSPLKPFVEIVGISYEGDNDSKEITLNGNGSGQKDEVLKLDMEAKDVLPVPVWKGHVFKGWNTDQEGKGTYLSDCTKIRNDMTLYAVWEKEVKAALNYKTKSCYVKRSFTLQFNTKMTGVKWKSGNSKVAKVDAKGKVTAVAKGNTVITASAGGKTYSCKVTVKAAPKK